MKCMLSVVGLFAGLVAFGADPVVSNVTMAQDAQTGHIEIGYDLAGGPAIITAEISCDGKVVWDEGTRGVTGDVNRVVAGDVRHTFVYRPSAGNIGIKGDLSVVVSAWAPDDPPDYMTASLSAEEPSTVRFYATTNAFPGGLLGNRAYREWVLVMRRIHAKDVVWKMGSDASEVGGGNRDYQTQHSVTNKADYYIGVFPVTQSQYKYLLTTDGDCSFTVEGSMRPWDLASLNAIRDNAVDTPGNWVKRWPDPPHADSWLGRARKLTGVAFDIPSEAQWEFACRSGIYEPAIWNDGTPMLNTGAADPGMPGRTTDNQAEPGRRLTTGRADNGTPVVGSYPPSRWGLYDMHGGVWEIVLDWIDYQEKNYQQFHGEVNIDPEHPENTRGGQPGKYIVRKGGSWEASAPDCRAGARTMWIGPTKPGNAAAGFRLTCPVTVFVAD